MKHLQTFESFLNEAVLNEIGEGSAKPFDWKFDYSRGDESFWRWESEEGDHYYTMKTRVNKEGYLFVNFESTGGEGGQKYGLVNKGEMFRTMATVMDIIKSIVKKDKNILGIDYQPAEKGSDDGKSRDLLYRAFLSKAYPGVEYSNPYPDAFGPTWVRAKFNK